MSTLQFILENTTLDRTDARVILCHLIEKHFSWPRTALLSRNTEILNPFFIEEWRDLERRRLFGEPVAYLIGMRPFHAIELRVNPSVLIPRPETELLVDIALERINELRCKHPTKKIRLLDLGTGSGAIALALAHADPEIEIHATDISFEALKTAQENARYLNLYEQVQFHLGSWYEALDLSDTKQFDVILSNPPYIHPADPHLNQGDLRFEPVAALSDQVNGLNCIEVILKDCLQYLSPGGSIAIEHGFEQAASVSSLMAQNGLLAVHHFADLAGHPRVTSACSPTL